MHAYKKFRCQLHAETCHDQDNCCQSCGQNTFHACINPAWQHKKYPELIKFPVHFHCISTLSFMFQGIFSYFYKVIDFRFSFFSQLQNIMPGVRVSDHILPNMEFYFSLPKFFQNPRRTAPLLPVPHLLLSKLSPLDLLLLNVRRLPHQHY